MIDTDGPDADALGNDGCDWAHSGTDCGYNVQTYDSGTDTVYSELAYMYYVNLGLKPYYNPDGTVRSDWGIFGNGTCNGTNCSSYGQKNVGLVDNLLSYMYWSGLEYAPNDSNAWGFGTDVAHQFADDKANAYFAWAVRPGDVAAASGVPEPGTVGLLALGLLGLGLARRRG